MKISKYLHSCVLFELDGFKLLFDLGKFSFAEGQVNPEMFADVQSIIITHIHPDHLDTDNLKKIVSTGKAAVYTIKQVGEQLDKAGITWHLIEPGIFNIGPFELEAVPVTHEPILDNPLPDMMAFVINNKVLYPVDSMEDALFKYKNIELLLMVTMAPFASELRIAGFADQLQPKQILLVHDGYAKPFFIKQRYDAYTKHFEKQGIKFYPVNQVGESIEI